MKQEFFVVALGPCNLGSPAWDAGHCSGWGISISIWKQVIPGKTLTFQASLYMSCRCEVGWEISACLLVPHFQKHDTRLVWHLISS